MNNDIYVYKVENLSFSYGKHQVIRNLSLTIHKGGIITIIGANGCGKSTLFHLLTKNLQPESGSILVNGKNISDIRLKEFAGQAAIVHQYNTAPADLTVEKLIGYGRTPYHTMGIPRDSVEDKKKIQWAMEITNTEKYKDKPVRKLSGGQRQRVWIAMALAQDTRILFLDEPTTYLDIRYQLQILQLIRKLNRRYGMTIVMVLHDINQSLYYSDEIIAMKDGRVLKQGKPEAVVTADLLRAVYGVQLNMREVDGKPFVLPV